MPFLAEELHQNLVCSFDKTAPESVHLAEWPKVAENLLNEGLVKEMAVVMQLASLGHAARNKSSVKVRQPLGEVAFALGTAEEAEVVSKYADLLTD